MVGFRVTVDLLNSLPLYINSEVVLDSQSTVAKVNKMPIKKRVNLISTSFRRRF